MSYISDKDSAPLSLFGVNGGNTSTDASISTLVGAKFNTPDGRVFVLAQNGGTALTQGTVIQSPVQSTAFQTLSPATTSTTGYSASYPIVAAIGGLVIQLATAGTAVLANEFTGGLLTVVYGAGVGQTLKVSSNTAASTTSAFTVTLEDAFSVATDSTSRYTLTTNPYGSLNGTDNTTHGVVVQVASGSAQTGVPIGVTIYPIAASTATVPTYGFLQTKGACGVLGTDTAAVGTLLGISTTAGQVLAYTVGSKLSPVGVAMVLQASGYANLVNINL